MKIDQDALLKFLSDKGYQPKLQEETSQIYFILKISDSEFPLFVRIFDTSDLLQLLVFMPCQIKHGAQGDLARLLHLLNKELDVPGFGMDENAEVAFYRVMLPIPGKKIDEKTLETFFKSLELICESISPPVIAVASGKATFSSVVEQARKQSTKTGQN